MLLVTKLAPNIAWHPFRHAMRSASRCKIPFMGRITGIAASYLKEDKQV
jgi:hypothetical protein